MKKTTGICLFTGMIFLLLVMIVYLLFTQQNSKEEKQNLAAATEEISDAENTTETIKTTESISICEPYAYKVLPKDGVLVVYQGDGVTEFFETNIRTRDLTPEILAKLEHGICFSSEQELYAFLESYSS